MKLKVTKWDIFFQLVIVGLVVGVFPAVTIIINYKNSSWLMAGLNVFILTLAFYRIHKLQVKKQDKERRKGNDNIRNSFNKLFCNITINNYFVCDYKKKCNKNNVVYDTYVFIKPDNNDCIIHAIFHRRLQRQEKESEMKKTN